MFSKIQNWLQNMQNQMGNGNWFYLDFSQRTGQTARNTNGQITQQCTKNHPLKAKSYFWNFSTKKHFE